MPRKVGKSPKSVDVTHTPDNVDDDFDLDLAEAQEAQDAARLAVSQQFGQGRSLSSDDATYF
jgi:hypothetical protein